MKVDRRKQIHQRNAVNGHKVYILSFNVNKQQLMVIQNSCEVNREHARICGGVLSM